MRVFKRDEIEMHHMSYVRDDIKRKFVNSSAQGGAEPESLQSIKFNAPNFYASQDRAVTVEDYKSKVKQLYANTQSVSAWGGEDAETPFYGRVYISILPTSGSNLTDATKERIVKDLKNPIIFDYLSIFK